MLTYVCQRCGNQVSNISKLDFFRTSFCEPLPNPTVYTVPILMSRLPKKIHRKPLREWYYKMETKLSIPETRRRKGMSVNSRVSMCFKYHEGKQQITILFSPLPKKSRTCFPMAATKGQEQIKSYIDQTRVVFVVCQIEMKLSTRCLWADKHFLPQTFEINSERFWESYERQLLTHVR